MRILPALALLTLPCATLALPEGLPTIGVVGLASSRNDTPSVRDFGARGDGVSDDTEAIQAAIDSVKPGAAAMNSAAYGSRVGRVYVPIGRYLVRRSLKVYTGVWLDGAGNGSTLEAAEDFPAGAAIVKSSTEGLSPEGYGGCALTNLHFRARAGTGVWAYSHSEMKKVGGVRAENLWIETPKGFDLTPYSQNSWVKNVLFTGEIDQMLRLKGNFNTFEQLDKEGSTGDTSDPYIQVDAHAAGASSSNHFQSILIEQITSPSKPLVSAIGADELVLEDFWLEPTKTNGFGLVLERCKDFHIRGRFAHVGSWGKVAIRDGSWGSIETLNTDGEDVEWSRTLQLDRSSFVRIDATYSRRSADAFPLDSSGGVEHGVFIDRVLSTQPVPGVLPVSRPRSVAMQNLLANSSFEAGAFGWTLARGFSVEEFPPAETAPGRMLHLTGGTGTRASYQEVTIPEEWVGRVMTFSFVGRVRGQGFLAPLVSGAGIELGPGSSRIDERGGWVLATITIQPRAAGKMKVGFWFGGALPASHAYVDEVRLAFGTEGRPAGGQLQDLELGRLTITTGVGPPSNGTWKQGDIVFNSTPGPGGPLAWRAISGGSPGTWQSVAAQPRAVTELGPAVVAAQSCSEFALPLTGARIGAECAVGLPPELPASLAALCRVRSADTVALRVCNPTGAAISMGKATYSVRIFEP